MTHSSLKGKIFYKIALNNYNTKCKKVLQPAEVRSLCCVEVLFGFEHFLHDEYLPPSESCSHLLLSVGLPGPEAHRVLWPEDVLYEVRGEALPVFVR